jgi:hypothetical protein
MTRPTPLLVTGALATAAWALGVAPAAAEQRASGWYAEFGLGGAGALAEAGQDLAIGPTVTMRGGGHPLPWLGVGVAAAVSSHEATVPAPPSGEWLQIVRGQLEAEAGGRLGRIGVFVHAGVGLGLITSTILERTGRQEPGEHASLAAGGGLRLTYQLQNRHYALGLGADATYLHHFDATTLVDARLLLRYTF